MKTIKKFKILEIGTYNVEEPNFCGFCSFCSPIWGKKVLTK
ncbi:hypothetical protein Marpi_0927 [Marinitoga piezophila KA3]|uniref:Uncharacterized protein n=1 Tax=Marinitoga piezophila (strain DSM 14283 / JCM 11233 / KA3) TaxID=443254 RepID=H2J7E9_MARPK|nr:MULTISPECIES: hypothetical protein [Marinitoga]AEX85341.1 hypothetical protein Marpi_0927 [Marinitoga piezophila KA3]